MAQHDDERAHSYMHNALANFATEVPPARSPAVPNDLVPYVTRLRQLFESRPLWSPLALRSKLPPEDLRKLKSYANVAQVNSFIHSHRVVPCPMLRFTGVRVHIGEHTVDLVTIRDLRQTLACARLIISSLYSSRT